MIEWDRDPIYEETKEILRRLKIEGVFFDLDDTIIYTAEIFRRFIEEYVREVSEGTDLDLVKLKSVLEEVERENYIAFGVNPRRWPVTVQRVAERYSGYESRILDNLPILQEIYKTEPRMKEGAKIVLDVLHSSGVKIGLVTHGNVEWSCWKLDTLGLWNYFDSVTIADEDRHKCADDWQRAIDGLGVEAKNCLVVGDNLGGDIRAGAELGARTVWMPSSWSVYRSGTVPENTVQIEKIGDLLAALGRLR